MVKTLRKVFSSRVGSDDKIARLASPTDQWDSATAGHHWASVEQLRQELEAKERMIGALQRRLQAQSSEERLHRANPLAHRKSRSLIARSASIISRKKYGKLMASH